MKQVLSDSSNDIHHCKTNLLFGLSTNPGTAPPGRFDMMTISSLATTSMLVIQPTSGNIHVWFRIAVKQQGSYVRMTEGITIPFSRKITTDDEPLSVLEFNQSLHHRTTHDDRSTYISNLIIIIFISTDSDTCCKSSLRNYWWYDTHELMVCSEASYEYHRYYLRFVSAISTMNHTIE